MIGNGYSGCSADQFSPEMQIGAHKCASNAHGSRQRSRITQLLEAVKFEFEVLMQEVAELNALRHSLQDLERTHQKMKKSYEDGTVIHQCRAIDGRSQQAADVGEMGCISSEIAAQRQKSMNSGMSAVGLPMGMKDTGYCPEVLPSYRGQGPAGRNLHMGVSNTRHSEQPAPQRRSRPDSIGQPSVHISASSSQGFSPNCAPSGELKRDSSELYLRHSCTDSYVIHGLRKVQRLENDKRASVDKETEKPDRRSHASVGNYDQLKRHEDSEKDAPSDQEKQQYSRLSTKDYYKQAVNLRSLENDFITYTWSKGRVNFTVAYQPKCEVAKNPMLKIELVHDLSPESVVCCVKFSDDGGMLATGCNYAAHIYNVTTGAKISTLVNEQVQKDTDLYIRSLCFSPDAKYIATGAEDHVIRVWDIQRRKIKWSFDTHEQDVYSLDWLKEENLLVSGSGDKTIRMWDIDQGTCVLTMSNDDSKFMRNVKGNSSRSREVNVTSVAVNPAYFKCIATGSLDGVVRLWDLKTSSLLERFEGHKDSVYSVSFSPDGKSLVSGSLDKTVKVWDLSPQSISHFERASLKGGSSFKPSIQEEPVEPAINQTPRKNFVGHTDFVLSVAFAGSSFISGRSYGQPEEGGSKVDDFSDVEWIISGSKDCSVIFWGGLSQSSSRREKSRQNGGDSSTRKLILQGHDNSVALASHSGIFATGSGDTHARIWRLSTVYNQKQNYLAPSNSYAHPPSQSEGDGPLFNFQNSQQQPNSSLPRSQSQNPKMSPQQSARPCPGSLPASSFHRRFGSAQADKNTHEMGDIDRNWGRKDMQYDIEPERSSADNEKST